MNEVLPIVRITLPACPKCHSSNVTAYGTRHRGRQRYYSCDSCFARFIGIIENPRQNIPTVGQH